MAHVKLGRFYEILFCGMFSLMSASNLHIIGEPNHVSVVISNKSRGLLKEKVTLFPAWVQTRRRGRDIGLLRLNIYQLLLKTHVTRYIHNLGPLLPGNNVDVEFVCVCVCVCAHIRPKSFSLLVTT